MPNKYVDGPKLLVQSLEKGDFEIAYKISKALYINSQNTIYLNLCLLLYSTSMSVEDPKALISECKMRCVREYHFGIYFIINREWQKAIKCFHDTLKFWLGKPRVKMWLLTFKRYENRIDFAFENIAIVKAIQNIGIFFQALIITGKFADHKLENLIDDLLNEFIKTDHLDFQNILNQLIADPLNIPKVSVDDINTEHLAKDIADRVTKEINQIPKKSKVKKITFPPGIPWHNIKLIIDPDYEKVRVVAGRKTIKIHYSRLGFPRGKSGKYGKWWAILVYIAKGYGNPSEIKKNLGEVNSKTLKSYISKIRNVLNEHFGTKDDPDPFYPWSDHGYYKPKFELRINKQSDL